MAENKSIVDLFVEKSLKKRSIRKAQADMPIEDKEKDIDELSEEEAKKEIEKPEGESEEKEELAAEIEEEVIDFIKDICDFYDIECEVLIDTLAEVFSNEEAKKELVEKVKASPKEVEEEEEGPMGKEIPIEEASEE